MVATNAAAPLVGKAPTTLSVVGTGITIRLAGRTGQVPGLAAGTPMVLPQQVLGPEVPAPQLMLVAGPRLNTARLTAAVRRALPGASVTFAPRRWPRSPPRPCSRRRRRPFGRER